MSVLTECTLWMLNVNPGLIKATLGLLLLFLRSIVTSLKILSRKRQDQPVNGTTVAPNLEFILLHGTSTKPTLLWFRWFGDGGVFPLWVRYAGSPGKGCYWVGVFLVL